MNSLYYHCNFPESQIKYVFYVEYNYEDSVPSKSFYSNGDPGYPAETSNLEIEAIFFQNVNILNDLFKLFPEIVNDIEKACLADVENSIYDHLIP